MQSIPVHAFELVVIATDRDEDLAGFVRRLHRRLEHFPPMAGEDGPNGWQLTIAASGSTNGTWDAARQLAAELEHVVAVRIPVESDRQTLRNHWASSPATVVGFLHVPALSARTDDIDQLLAPLLSQATLIAEPPPPAEQPLPASAPPPADSTRKFDFRGLLSRRAALLTLGGAGAALILAACRGSSPANTAGPSTTSTGASNTTAGTTAATASTAASSTTTAAPTTTTTPAPVTLAPEITEGPYYLDLNLVRSNIVEDRTGVPLALDLAVVDVATNKPIQGAVVDIWHADGNGLYSGFIAASTGGGGGGPGSGASDSSTFLRGTQLSDANGRVVFNTIYPGWYRGRTVHIHVKVHVGGRAIHTGQFFFDDKLSDSIYAASAPYSSRPNRDTRNANDSIYSGGGAQSILPVQQSGSGYAAAMAMGVATA